MAINTNSSLYGVEPSKQIAHNIKSKRAKFLGFKFPFGDVDSGEFLMKSSDEDLIKGNLRQLLLTKRGERVMLPKFGTNLHKYLMEPMDQVLFSQIRSEIEESIYKYAKNVIVEKIQVIPMEETTYINGGYAIRVNLFCRIAEDFATSFEVKVEIR